MKSAKGRVTGTDSIGYLRVSTVSQVNTDYEPEGISISAQRNACVARARDLDSTYIRDFIDPGRSARSLEGRTELRALMEYLLDNPNVRYVIVYALSRLARNTYDDAALMVQLQKLGVTLLSATERSLDDSPTGRAMHGMIAVFNQYQSDASGMDIKHKMGHKARQGGTITRTKVGYLNSQDVIDGREVRTVVIDPERGPFIQLAFELAATNEYSMTRLASVLAARGLRMRARVDRPAAPMTAKYLTTVLRDRYYIGKVTYEGEEYEGRHDALVTPELFAQVQVVLDSRLAKTGERQRKHHHYLKSALWCGRCHEQGVESRLILDRRKGGNGSDYWYFLCTARQDGECDAPYVRVESLEAKVVEHYATVRLPAGFGDRFRAALLDMLANEESSTREHHKQLLKTLHDLDTREENLIDLVAEGGAVAAKVRQRLVAITEERARAKDALDALGPKLASGVALIQAALDLVDDPQELYRQATDPVRRQLNQVFFNRLYIDGFEIVDDELAEPFDGLLFHRRRPTTTHRRSRAPHKTSGTPKSAVSRAFTCATLLDQFARGIGSSKATMVGDTGIEPVTPAV